MEKDTTGFVDLQVNGYQGVHFGDDDLTSDQIDTVSRRLMEAGVIGYCPTVVTGALEQYERNLPLLAKACESDQGARVLGIHIEGPFISPKDGARGAHPLEHVRAPGVEDFELMRRWADDRIAILSLAPEEEGALELIEHVASKTKTVVSLAHHLADAEQIRRAIDAGARLATHVGNGLPNMLNRHTSPIYTLLADDRLMGMFITDGFHLPPDLIRVSLRTKGVERFIVTSDVVHLSGLEPGEYGFAGSAVVLEENGFLHMKDQPYLAGSACNMLDCMNHLASLGELDEAGLRAVGRDNPLRALGLSLEEILPAKAPTVTFQNGRFHVG